MIFALEKRFGWEFIEADSYENALKKYNEKTHWEPEIKQFRVLLDEKLQLNRDTFNEIARVETLRNRPVVMSPRRRRFLRQRKRRFRH